MLEDEELPSDSDQSDDDYNPDGNHSEAGSEVESDGEAESGDDEVVAKQRNSSKTRKRKSNSHATSRRKSRRLGDATAEIEDVVAKNDAGADAPEENDEEAEKKRAESLWASFLSDTADVRPDPPKPATKEREKVDVDAIIKTTAGASTSDDKRAKVEAPMPEKRTITEIFDFAGEKVEVQKVVPAGNGSSKETSNGRQRSAALKGGIGSILNQLGNAKKISVLEKTKLDWTSFKQKEGIEEDLQTHNKGKDGFLERQDFLQRTDLRQFEIEKNQRLASKRK